MNEQPHLTDQAFYFLRSIRKWSNFISIMGFIGIGFMVLSAFASGPLMEWSQSVSGQQQTLPYPSFLIMVVYLIAAVIYFFPVWFLYRFSKNLKDALITGDESRLTAAFSYLNSHYRYIGILIIIGLVISVLAIVVTIIGVAMGAMLAA